MFTAILGYTDGIYPGWRALPPCLGAALYIAGGTHLQSSFADMLTKNKALVFTGVISYSLYLWHWPILVYYQNWLYQRNIDLKSGIFLLTAIFLVSVFSWRVIEKPVRQKPIFKRHGVLWTSVACSFGIIILFINQIISSPSIQGVEYRFTSDRPAYFAEYLDENPSQSVIVVGDSHAGQLIPLVDRLAKKYHFSYMYSHMKPYHTYNPHNDMNTRKEREKYCSDFVNRIKTQHFDTAIIAYWYDYQVIGGPVAKDTLHNPLRSFDYSIDNPYDVLFLALKDTILLLKEHGVKNIYCAAPMPYPIGVVPVSANKLSGLLHFNTEKINAVLGESAGAYEARTLKTKKILDKLVQTFPDIHLLDPKPYFLNPEKTRFDVVSDTVSFYSDNNHLSTEGVLLLTPLFEPVFNSLQK